MPVCFARWMLSTYLFEMQQGISRCRTLYGYNFPVCRLSRLTLLLNDEQLVDISYSTFKRLVSPNFIISQFICILYYPILYLQNGIIQYTTTCDGRLMHLLLYSACQKYETRVVFSFALSFSKRSRTGKFIFLLKETFFHNFLFLALPVFAQ
jgi:hypothetical protein